MAGVSGLTCCSRLGAAPCAEIVASAPGLSCASAPRLCKPGSRGSTLEIGVYCAGGRRLQATAAQLPPRAAARAYQRVLGSGHAAAAQHGAGAGPAERDRELRAAGQEGRQEGSQG